MPYQLATSLGTGPIAIDTRRLGLGPDAILLLSISGLASGVFSNDANLLDANGEANATLGIPLHNAFVAIKVAAPSGIASISNTFSFIVR